MSYIEDFKEPIDFIFSENLLSGNSTSKNISKDDVDDIIDEFFSDEVWSINHLIKNEVSKFRFHSDYDKSEIEINSLLKIFNEKLEKKYVVYRKSKIKKENSAFDDFFFSVFDEIYNHLRIIAIHRAIYGIEKNSFLEKVFAIYKDGLLPYKFKSDVFYTFNPIVLK